MGLENIRQCKWCRRPYQPVGSYNTTFCSVCDRMFDEAFVKIRDYLDDNPDANVHEVSEATEVDSKVIMQLLKDDRLSFTSGEYIKCEQCGAPIASGRFCGACQETMKKGMSSLLSDYQEKASAKTPAVLTPHFSQKMKK